MTKQQHSLEKNFLDLNGSIDKNFLSPPLPKIGIAYNPKFIMKNMTEK